jgi:hypothetical protein
LFGCILVGNQVQVLDRLPHDPMGHGVDIATYDIAPKAVGLDQWRTASHEWVDNKEPLQIIRPKKGVRNRSFPELRKQQASKQRSRPTGKPLVNGYGRAIDLLNLLLAKCQFGNKRNVKSSFYGHSKPSILGRYIDIYAAAKVVPTLLSPLAASKEPRSSTGVYR